MASNNHQPECDNYGHCVCQSMASDHNHEASFRHVRASSGGIDTGTCRYCLARIWRPVSPERNGIWTVRSLDANHEEATVENVERAIDHRSESGKNRFGDRAMAIAERVTGDEHGFDEADAATVAVIMGWVQTMPALNTMAKVGLTAIAELSKTDPALARSLAGEL
jgi:hypothetical protein